MAAKTVKEQLQIVRKAEWDYCTNHVEYFIEEYVHIEDRDAEEIAQLFKLWPGQKMALKDLMEYKLNIILKARQLGMTWLSLAFAVHQMIFKKGYSVVALSKKEDDAKELVRRVEFILRHMPAWLMKIKENKDGFLTYDPTTQSISINRKDGEPSTFKSFSASPDSGRSFTANLVILDEWAFQQYAKPIWTAAYPTINRPNGGKVIGLSTIERGSLFEELWIGSKDGTNDFHRIFLGWDTDPRRTPEWYEKTKRALGDATMAEYPATEEEAFLIPGGAFFNEVRAYVHLKKSVPIPDYYKRYVTIDYGLDELAVLWIYLDNEGRARVYREYTQSDLIISQAAESIKAMSNGERIHEYLAPPDLWNRRQDTGKSAAEIFGENGVWLTKTSNNRVQGWLNLKEWLNPYEITDEQSGEKFWTADLTIDEGVAPKLWRSLLNIQRDKNNVNDVADEPHYLTHIVDSVRNFAIARPRPTREPKAAVSEVDKHKKRMARTLRLGNRRAI